MMGHNDSHRLEPKYVRILTSPLGSSVLLRAMIRMTWLG